MKTFLFLLIKLVLSSLLLSRNQQNKYDATEIESAILDLSKSDYNLVYDISKQITRKLILPHGIQFAQRYALSKYPIMKKALIKTEPFLSNNEFDSLIIPMLKDNDTSIMLEAIIAAGNRRMPRYENILYDVYYRYFRNESVALCLISAYSNFKSKKSADFVASFYNPYNVTVSSMVIESLGRMQTDYSAENLIHIFDMAMETEKISIIGAMRHFRRNKKIVYFLDSILADKNCSFYPYAIQTAGELEIEKYYPLIQKSIKSETELIRKSAIYAVSFFGRADAIPELLKLVNNNSADNNDQIIYDSIERICSIYSFDEIQKQLAKSDHPSLVAVQLGKIADKSSIDVLMELMNHEDPINRIAAIEAITKIKGAQHESSLIARLEDSSPMEFMYILKKLKKLMDESSLSPETPVNALEGLFNHEKLILLKTVTRNEEILLDYFNLLKSESNKFRWIAVSLAGNFIKHRFIIDELKHILETGDFRERYYCVSVLLGITGADKDTADYLKTHLKQEKNPVVRKLIENNI